jgi:hypothetical protein
MVTAVGIRVNLLFFVFANYLKSYGNFCNTQIRYRYLPPGNSCNLQTSVDNREGGEYLCDALIVYSFITALFLLTEQRLIINLGINFFLVGIQI